LILAPALIAIDAAEWRSSWGHSPAGAPESATAQGRAGGKLGADTPTPVVDDSVPVQPDTGRQPRVSASRFTYPEPGPAGRLAD